MVARRRRARRPRTAGSWAGRRSGPVDTTPDRNHDAASTLDGYGRSRTSSTKTTWPTIIVPVPSTAMTTDVVQELQGLTVLVCAPDGPVVRDERDAVDLVGAALGQGAELVLLPVSRLTEDFFTLSTGIAGAIIQKFVNYRLRLAVVGDISDHLARSSALR